mgnify:CR=1 FL=1
MIGYVMIGTNDLDRGARFYDALLAPLGLVQVERVETYAAYAPKAARDAIEFYVTGNAGSQGLAVAVRAIAEREMEGDAGRRAIVRETLTGLVNGTWILTRYFFRLSFQVELAPCWTPWDTFSQFFQ